MKLQIVLRFLTLLTALLAFTLVSDIGGDAARCSLNSASPSRLTEMRTEGVEVAAGGIQVGQMQA